MPLLSISATRWTQIRDLMRPDWAGPPYVALIRGQILTGLKLFWSGWFLMWSSASVVCFSLSFLWLILADLCSFFSFEGSSEFIYFLHVGIINLFLLSLFFISDKLQFCCESGTFVFSPNWLDCFGQIWMTIAWNNWHPCERPQALDFEYRKSGVGAKSIEVRSLVDSIRVKFKKESLGIQIGTYRFVFFLKVVFQRDV